MSPAPVAVAIRRLAHAPDLPLPAYQTEQAAGMDLMACVEAEVRLPPGGRALIPTGFAIALPAGFEAQVRPRSGLALRLGLGILNAPGTIDADYRGEIGVIVVNLGEAEVTIGRGLRIAQLVVAPVTRAAWVEVETLESSARGAGGFGSTGLSG